MVHDEDGLSGIAEWLPLVGPIRGGPAKVRDRDERSWAKKWGRAATVLDEREWLAFALNEVCSGGEKNRQAR
jgi:hypothetical protein